MGVFVRSSGRRAIGRAATKCDYPAGAAGEAVTIAGTILCTPQLQGVPFSPDGDVDKAHKPAIAEVEQTVEGRGQHHGRRGTIGLQSEIWRRRAAIVRPSPRTRSNYEAPTCVGTELPKLLRDTKRKLRETAISVPARTVGYPFGNLNSYCAGLASKWSVLRFIQCIFQNESSH